MKRITPKGALHVARDLDRLSALIASEAPLLNIPPHIAEDAIHKFDTLADHIERQAGLNPRTKQALTGLDVYKEPGYDPENIGEEVGGPLEDDADEPYMKGEFTQQENRELREKQQAGELPGGSLAPQAPRPGVQAAFKGLIAALKGSNLQGKQAAAVERALVLATTVVTAGEVPEAFKKQWDKNKNKDDDKGDDDKKEDKKPDFLKDKEDGKKASHGYDLFAK